MFTILTCVSYYANNFMIINNNTKCRDDGDGDDGRSNFRSSVLKEIF